MQKSEIQIINIRQVNFFFLANTILADKIFLA